MKCQSCGKREATVRYMEKINGNKQELHLCVDCAKKLGFVDFSNMFSPIFTSIPSFFEDFNLVEEDKCKTCGYTFEDYANTGLFGCPNCYDTFSDRLDEIFLKLHGKNRHLRLSENKTKIDNAKKEKVKKNENVTKIKFKNDELLSLKEELKELIKQEEYEKAAVVRDKIKAIEKK